MTSSRSPCRRSWWPTRSPASATGLRATPTSTWPSGTSWGDPSCSARRPWATRWTTCSPPTSPSCSPTWTSRRPSGSSSWGSRTHEKRRWLWTIGSLGRGFLSSSAAEDALLWVYIELVKLHFSMVTQVSGRLQVNTRHSLSIHYGQFRSVIRFNGSLEEWLPYWLEW